MSDIQKITSSHLTRVAVVYLRQSSAAQVEHNRELTDRQYALVHKAGELGWPTDRVVVIDEDLGLTGSGAVARSGFARLTAEVALGHVGLVLGLEVSRLARNNADWYRLIDLCGLSNTLIGHGLYHPALFNDRLLLGLKGTMSEAELYVLRARLNGGIRNKAARGELRRGLPVGFVWGEADGEVRFHPDEGVRTTIASVFTRFAETGSARRVWLWFRLHGLRLPLRMHQGWEIRWVEASYTAIHQVLSNPVYAGAYAYGKTRQEVTLDASGQRKKRMRHSPQSEWQVLIKDHHEGFIDWRTYEANQARLAANTRPGPHKVGGAVREGSALLQGLASCGHCGRRLKTHYSGRNTTPGYHCAGKIIVEGRGCYCLNVGGVQIDEAIAKTFLAALEPSKLAATIAAAERLEADSEAALKQWRLGVERASYEASRAERRYIAVDPDNRLVARGLERDWEQRLADLEAAKDELARRLEQRPMSSVRRSVSACSPSGPTSPRSGMRRRPHPATARYRRVMCWNSHDRPKTIENRGEAGHWEGDLIICKCARPVLILHERKSPQDRRQLARRAGISDPIGGSPPAQASPHGRSAARRPSGSAPATRCLAPQAGPGTRGCPRGEAVRRATVARSSQQPSRQGRLAIHNRRRPPQTQKALPPILNDLRD